METDSSLNLFTSIVTGEYKPDRNVFDPYSAFPVPHPSFAASIDAQYNVRIEALSKYLFKNDFAYILLSCSKCDYLDEDEAIEIICRKWRYIYSEINIPEPESEKEQFYFNLTQIAFCLAVSRIYPEEHSETSTKYKTAYSRNIVRDIKELIIQLDKYEQNLFFQETITRCFVCRENQYAIYVTRMYLFHLLVFVSKTFSSFNTFHAHTIDDWKQILYSVNPFTKIPYQNDWPLVRRAAAIVHNLYFQPASNEEILTLYKNDEFLNTLTQVYSSNALFARINGHISLTQWVIMKDCDHWNRKIVIPMCTDQYYNSIIKNEHDLFDEFSNITYSELFHQVFLRIPEKNKLFIAKKDLILIESIINESISTKDISSFLDNYKISVDKDFYDSLQKVLRGSVYETCGFEILKHAEAHALIRYRDFLSDFLSNGNNRTCSADQEGNNRSDFIQSSFGFKGDKVKLKNCLDFLQLKLSKGLVDINRSCIDDLVLTLLSDFESKDSKPLVFSCETTQLAYILRNIGPCFSNLTDDSIHITELFITNTNAKLTKSNLRKSLSSCSNRPKDVEIIDLAVSELMGKNSN